MPFDIVAWYESQACTALTGVAAVSDPDVYHTSADDIFVKKEAPYLAGSLCGAITQATLKYYEFRQPSLKIPYRFYQGGDLNDPFLGEAFNNLWASPLPLYPQEKLNAYVQNATDEIDMIVAWLASGPARLSDLENVRPTHSITGYNDGALTAGSWTDVTITWDQDLPKGRYAVVGMKVGSYLAALVAYGVARLLLLDTKWRPGVIVRAAEADKLGLASISPGFMYGERWPLMNEISFEHTQMPNLQMLCAAANTDHVVELLLQKIA